jgi:hypothetical protein
VSSCPPEPAHGAAREEELRRVSGHDRDELTPADIALLAENWSRANERLDRLLALNGEHRAAGCSDWFCGDDDLAEALAALDQLHQVQLVLRAAIERLTPRAAAADAAHDDVGQPHDDDLRRLLGALGAGGIAEVLDRFVVYVSDQPAADGHPPVLALMCRRPHAGDWADGPPTDRRSLLVPATLAEDGQGGIDLFGTGVLVTQVGLSLGRLVLDALEHEAAEH